jgi:hypothetical protein
MAVLQEPEAELFVHRSVSYSLPLCTTERLTEVVKGAGGVNHSKWRSSKKQRHDSIFSRSVFYFFALSTTERPEGGGESGDWTTSNGDVQKSEGLGATTPKGGLSKNRGNFLCSIAAFLNAFLCALQNALKEVVKGVGGLDHSKWRSFRNRRVSGRPSRNFIDGDLVEQYLDLKKEQMQRVVKIMGGKTTAEELGLIVEELSRVLH